MNKWQKYISKERIPLICVVFYSVGLLLFVFPLTREVFIDITPFTLLLVIGVVFYFHKEWNLKTIMLFGSIVLSSYLLEMVGVRSGMPFGTYQYADGLGIKLLDTPLIIGLNWLFLVYASQSIACSMSQNALIKIVLGAGLMVLYDVVLEWVAPTMQMWHFTGGYPPLSNFTTWFLAAAIFQSGFVLLHIKVENRPARLVFCIQPAFFALIGLHQFIFKA